MTTQLNGTEFTARNTTTSRRPSAAMPISTLGMRRDQRRVRRANRAI